MFVINLWVREQTVVGVSNFVILCGHVFFLVSVNVVSVNILISVEKLFSHICGVQINVKNSLNVALKLFLKLEMLGVFLTVKVIFVNLTESIKIDMFMLHKVLSNIISGHEC